MNRTKLYSRNLIGAAAHQIVVLVAGLIIPRIFLEYYGSEINGLVTSITQFFTYFFLVEAGLSASLTYSLYLPLSERNIPAINGIIAASKKSYFQVGLIYSALTLVLAALYPLFIQTHVLSSSFMFVLVVVIGLTGIIDFFTLAKSRVLLTADQRSYVISYSSALSLVLNSAIIIILARLRVDIIVLRTVALSSVLLRSFILNLYVNKNYSYLNYNGAPNMSALSKRWDALFLQLLGAAQSGAPVIIATIFTNLITVSVYSIYNIVIGGINGMLTVFTTSAPASFGNLIAKKEEATLQKAYQQFELAFLSIITVVYITASYMIIPFIRIYTHGITDANYILPVVGFLFALNGFLYHMKTPGGMLVIAAGLYRETRIQSSVQAIIIVLLGALLAPFYGLTGILSACVLSNFYRTIDLLFFIPKHVTHMPISKSLLRTIRTVLLYALALIPMMFLSITPTSFITWSVYAFIVFSSASAVVFIAAFVFDREQLVSLLQRVNLIANKS